MKLMLTSWTKFFENTAKQVRNEILKKLNDLNSTINTISNDRQKIPFYIHDINTDTNDVLKAIKSLRNFCSTGYSNIPESLIKPGEKSRHEDTL